MNKFFLLFISIIFALGANASVTLLTMPSLNTIAVIPMIIFIQSK